MRLKIFGALLGLLFLACPVYAQPEIKAIEEPMPIEKVFKLNPIDLEPETRTDLVQALEPGFSKKAGGDLFVVRFGADAFRYEYEGEWIEFQPLNHLPILAVSAANELYFQGYWTDTNLRFTVRDYGVKVDIILMSDAAPKEFSFRVSKSAKWQDKWIRRPYALATQDGIQGILLVDVKEKDGILTYNLNPTEIADCEYPIIIDPTFDVAQGADDATTWNAAVLWDNTQWMFGAITFGDHKTLTAWAKWPLDIPRASKITSSNMSVKAMDTWGSDQTHYITCLQDDDKWTDGNGFNGTNYADKAALDAISTYTGNVGWVPGTWVVGTWYDSPDLSSLLQQRIDDSTYDPTDSENKHCAFSIDEGPDILGKAAKGHQYEDAPANASELDVTYDPWAEVMLQGGFRLDSDGLKYYGD